MSVEVEYTCPLGHKCEEARDGKIYRCRWYVSMIGVDPQTGDQIDEFRCVNEWIPVLLVESTKVGNQTGAAVESFRNEMSKQNASFIGMLQQASKRRSRIAQEVKDGENERAAS